MPKTYLRLLTLLPTMVLANLCWGTEEQDKSVYHLFHPTPTALMREFTHDRPDVNDTPRTVDAGHFQLEMDLVAFTYDRRNPEYAAKRVTTWEVAPMFLKVGLTNWADAEVGLEPYIKIVTRNWEEGTRAEAHGFGDLTLRVKLNIWGNEEGETSFALIPFIKVPTARNGLGNEAWEGGINLPFELDLPHGWSVGVMPIFTVLRNEDDSGKHLQYGGAFTINYEIIKPLEWMVEFVGLASTETKDPWEGIFNSALIWKVNQNLDFDAGMRFGLTRAADDYRPYVGMSWRY